jgi:hypothetical protein
MLSNWRVHVVVIAISAVMIFLFGGLITSVYVDSKCKNLGYYQGGADLFWWREESRMCFGDRGVLPVPVKRTPLRNIQESR